MGQVLAETQQFASHRAGASMSPDQWQRIVGPKIAARTRVGRLTRGTLHIFAASSAWCNELSFLSQELVTRLRAAGWQVDQLRIRVASWEQAPTAGPTRRPLPSPLPAAMQERLALIEDPALREAIAEAAAWSLSQKRKS